MNFENEYVLQQNQVIMVDIDKEGEILLFCP